MDERRKKRIKKKRRNNRNLILILLILAIIFSFGRIRNVVELKDEEKQMLAQQAELEKERDLLKAKLKNIESKDYIQEEARKQLKMMDPDEILYVFDDKE